MQSAALHEKLKTDLDERKLEQVAEKKLAGMRDMLLLWKLNTTIPRGPTARA